MMWMFIGFAAWVGAMVYWIGMLMVAADADRQRQRQIDEDREIDGLPPFDWEEQ